LIVSASRDWVSEMAGEPCCLNSPDSGMLRARPETKKGPLRRVSPFSILSVQALPMSAAAVAATVESSTTASVKSTTAAVEPATRAAVEATTAAVQSSAAIGSTPADKAASAIEAPPADKATPADKSAPADKAPPAEAASAEPSKAAMEPGTGADKDPAYKPLGSVITIRRASVGIIGVVAPLAERGSLNRIGIRGITLTGIVAVVAAVLGAGIDLGECQPGRNSQ
jgi:hypothetical protein